MSERGVPTEHVPAIEAPDLRMHPPSSVHATFHGVVMLARVTDKAKACAFGELGDFTYNCPLDRAVLSFLGIDGEAYLRVVRDAISPAAIDEYVASFVARKSADEITRWNDAFIHYVPPADSDSWARLVTTRERYAPGRDDIVNWADVLDLEDGRDVPLRTQAPA